MITHGLYPEVLGVPGDGAQTSELATDVSMNSMWLDVAVIMDAQSVNRNCSFNSSLTCISHSASS